jgi:hypothetical protein
MLKYGCKLSEGEICKGYEIAIDDPVAQLLSRYFCVSTSKRKMDHSPGELEGEIDHLSRDAAVEYLLMPERVKKLEGQVEAMATSLEELNVLLKKLLGPSLDSSSQDTSQMKMHSYVR